MYSNVDIFVTKTSQKGLKVAKEDQKADGHDGHQAESGKERQRERLRGFDLKKIDCSCIGLLGQN